MFIVGEQFLFFNIKLIFDELILSIFKNKLIVVFSRTNFKFTGLLKKIQF